MRTGAGSLNDSDLLQLAHDIVARCTSRGASAAEALAGEGDEFSTVVRMGEVETLKQSGGRSIGVRVFFGKQVASTYSSDLSATGIDRMVNSAVELAKITSADPHAGLPDASELGQLSGPLDLYYPDVYSLPSPERIEYARRAERAAREADPRITNSEGGSFEASTGRRVLVNSLGFAGDYRHSYCSLAA